MGFTVIILIILSLLSGKWWLWILTVIFGMAWIGSKNQANTTNTAPVGTSNNPIITPYTPPIDDGTKATTSEKTDPSVSQLFKTNLICICKEYSGLNYYVLDSIPANKLKNAQKNYPVPIGGPVIALIDATPIAIALLEPGGTGLAIGENGISWNNSIDPKENEIMYWKELSSATIEKDDSYIKIGKGRFSMHVSFFNKDQAVDLLKKIQKCVCDCNAYEIKPTTSNNYTPPYPSTSRNDAPTNTVPVDKQEQEPFAEQTLKKVADDPIDINSADYDALLSLPGIGAVEAKRLIEHRQQHGPFFSIDAVSELLKLKPHHVKQWESRVIVSMPASDSQTPISDPINNVRGRTID